MLRHLLSSRRFSIGVIFFVICVVGGLLYSKYQIRRTEKQLAKTEQSVQSYMKTIQTAPHAQHRDAEKNDRSAAPHENAIETNEVLTAETDVAEIPNETVEDEDSQQVDTESALEGTTEAAVPLPARVSPFGLGIFPEIPADYPDQNVWERIESAAHDPEGGKKLELLIRVRIKLWEQGTETIGASYDDQTNHIYPNIPNVAYVQWAYIDEPDGTRSRYAAVVSGGVGPQHEESFDRGEVPAGVTVIPYDEAGIDPYTFLEFTYE